MSEASEKKTTKKPKYVPSPWSHIKPKEDERRKLTLLIAGAVPPNLHDRLDKLTSNYEVVTVMCAGAQPESQKSEMEDLIKKWAYKRRQKCAIIPWDDLSTLSGWMQFKLPDGNKAVIVYDDGRNSEDIKFANTLGKEEETQYKKIEMPKVQTTESDFADAVAKIPMSDSQLSK